MAVTLKDIAEKVQMSQTSVSFVLNDRPNRISPEKRELILKTAKEMNYIPNQNAVGLVKRKSHMIGVIIPDISNAFFSEIVSGIDSTVREHGWNTMIMTTNDDYEKDLTSIRTLAARGMDAIILVVASNHSPERADSYKKVMRSFNRPVILVDRRFEELGISTIGVDHKKGAYMAIDYLAGMGHQHIALLSGPQYRSSHRYLGVQQACQDRGLVITGADVFEGDYTMSSAYMLADNIVAGGYTGVFCFNDMMAYGLYKRCLEIGTRIPQDISLVGFDDIFFSDYINLTAIRQPAYNLGIEAARQAFYEIENPDTPPRFLYFEPSIRIRGSVAAQNLSK